MGFEYFYGFIGGETDQWTPYLFRNHTPDFPVARTSQATTSTTDMADEAIKYMRQLHAEAPDKPFFVYYVPGGTHAPHQPTKEWIDKIRAMHCSTRAGMTLRDTIFANQKRLGVVPPNAQADPWPDSLAEVGNAVGRPEEAVRPSRRRSSPPTWPTPTTRSAASSRRSRTWASSTTR